MSAEKTIALIREETDGGEVAWKQYHHECDMVTELIGTTRLVLLDIDDEETHNEIRARLQETVQKIEGGESVWFQKWKSDNEHLGYRTSRTEALKARGFSPNHPYEPYIVKLKQVFNAEGRTVTRQNLIEVANERPSGFTVRSDHLAEDALTPDEKEWLSGKIGRILPKDGLIITRQPFNSGFRVEKDPERCRKLIVRFKNRMKRDKQVKLELEQQLKRMNKRQRAKIIPLSELDEMYITPGMRNWTVDAYRWSLQNHPYVFDTSWNYPGRNYVSKSRGATDGILNPGHFPAPFYNQWACCNSIRRLAENLDHGMIWALGSWSMKTVRGQELQKFMSLRQKQSQGRYTRGRQLLACICRMIPLTVKRLVKNKHWCPEAAEFLQVIAREAKFSRHTQANAPYIETAYQTVLGDSVPETTDYFALKIKEEKGD